MATPTTSGVLSPEEFQALLTAVDAHGRARLHALAAGRDPGRSYPLPSQFSPGRLDQIPGPVLEAVTDYGINPMRGQLAANCDHVELFGRQFAQGQLSLEDFSNRLEDQIEQNTRDLEDTLDHLVAVLKGLGAEHPDWRNLIVSLFQQFEDFAVRTWGQVTDTYDRLVREFDEVFPRLGQMFSNWLQQLDDFLSRLSS